MKRVQKSKVYSFEEVKTRYYGKPGTSEREKFEDKLNKDIQKQNKK